MKKNGIWKKKQFYIEKNFYNYIKLSYKICIKKIFITKWVIFYEKELLIDRNFTIW
jgi:hypothetical protein